MGVRINISLCVVVDVCFVRKCYSYVCNSHVRSYTPAAGKVIIMSKIKEIEAFIGCKTNVCIFFIIVFLRLEYVIYP